MSASEYAVPSTEAIKQAIYTYGPVSVAVCAGRYFQAYSGGIFNTNESCDRVLLTTLSCWSAGMTTMGPMATGSFAIPGVRHGVLAGYMYIGYGVSQVGYGANFIEYAGGTVPAPAPVHAPDLTGVFPILHPNPKGNAVRGVFQVQNIGNVATSTWFRVLLYLSPDGVTKTDSWGPLK